MQALICLAHLSVSGWREANLAIPTPLPWRADNGLALAADSDPSSSHGDMNGEF